MDTETGTSIRFEDSIEEDNVLDDLSRCLFCQDECERDYGVAYLQGHAHKIIIREHKTEQNLYGVPNGFIGHQLQSIFVLEKLLGYPKDKCYQYLQRYSTLHPGLWFSICSTCRETVDKCYQISCKIMKHEKEMDQLRKSLTELIVFTNGLYLENEGNKQSIVNDIRSFVVSNAEDKTDSYTGIPYKANLCSLSPPNLPTPLSSPVSMSTSLQSTALSPPHVSEPDSDYEDYDFPLEPEFSSDSDDSSTQSSNQIAGEQTSKEMLPTPGTRKKRSWYWCETCHFSTKLVDIYKQHYQLPQHQDARKTHKCQFCGKTYSQTWQLFYHLRHMHHKELNLQPIECELCKKCFYSDKTFKKHMNEHKDDGNIGEQCGKELPSKDKLERNVKVVHSQSRTFGPDEKHYTFVDGVYTCEFCPKEYKSRFHINAHLKTIHLDLLRFRCHACDKVECTAGGLVQHMGKCAKLIEGKGIKCRLCEKIFSNKFYLSRHRKVVHPEKFLGNKYSCDLCGKLFYALNRFLPHKKKCTGPPDPDDKK